MSLYYTHYHLASSFVVALCFFLAIALPTQAQKIGINFLHTSLPIAQSMAQEQGKLLFIDAYTPSCRPCREMEMTVFNQKDVMLFMEQHFICLKVDISADGVEDFVQQYNAFSAPTLLFCAADGSVISREDAKMSATGFMQLAKSVIEGLVVELPTSNPNPAPTQPEVGEVTLPSPSPAAPTTWIQSEYPTTPAATHQPDLNLSLYSDKVQYEKLDAMVKQLIKQPNYTTEIPALMSYARLGKKLHKANFLALNTYIDYCNRIGEKIDINFIYETLTNLDSKAADYLLTNIQEFKHQFGGDRVNQKIIYAAHQSLLYAIQDHDDKAFARIVYFLQEAKLPARKQIIFNTQALYYQGIDDWGNYEKLVSSYIFENQITEPNILQDAAWNFFLYSTHPENLALARQWINTALAIQPSFENYYISGALAQKVGDLPAAQKVLEIAISVAPRQEVDPQKAIELLDSVNSKLR